jgi:hypothetical protein
MPRLLIPTIFIVLLAILAPYIFPWPYTLVLSIVASLFFPPTAIIVGALMDFLYYLPHAGSVPIFTIFGVLISTMAYFVHQFLKTRIM